MMVRSTSGESVSVRDVVLVLVGLLQAVSIIFGGMAIRRFEANEDRDQKQGEAIASIQAELSKIRSVPEENRSLLLEIKSTVAEVRKEVEGLKADGGPR